jgi:hypothetical protein
MIDSPTIEFQKPDGSIEFGSSPTEVPPGESGGVTRAITQWYKINDSPWQRMTWGSHRLKMMAMEAKTVEEFMDNLEKLEKGLDDQELLDNKNDNTRLLGLIADIRAAVGDPQGKLMQDELVEHCKDMYYRAKYNAKKLALLARCQKHMRDPERTLVCDILANGQLLPDPKGERYGFKATGKEHYGKAF